MIVEWGGQLELRAVSIAFQRPIHVYSADSPVVIMGEEIAVGFSIFVLCRQNRHISRIIQSTCHWEIITIHYYRFDGLCLLVTKKVK